MPIIVKISVKDFNPDKLREELAASGAGSILVGLSWAGFNRISERRYTPKPAREMVGSSINNGVRIEDFADPGELRFTITRDLTQPEDDALVTLLSNHNFTTLSAEQVRQDQDEADLTAILATERDQFIADVQALGAIVTAWDGQNTTQRQAATKDAIGRISRDLATVGKVMRWILRRERGAAI